MLPYSVANLGWVLASLVPYVAVMRAIVGHNFGVMLALAVPFVSINALAGQNGFLTAALIGGTLYLIPIRPVLAASASDYWRTSRSSGCCFRLR